MSADAAGSYVELHTHSSYSMLDGASRPAELAGRAAELGFSHMALTDHDSLAGSLEFGHAARAAGITPITGAEVTVIDELQRTCHVTLIAEDRTGYENLCELLTAAYRGDKIPVTFASARTNERPQPPGRPHRSPGLQRGGRYRPDPSVTLDELAAHAEGLILMTGCARQGVLSVDLDGAHPSRARETLHRLQHDFGHDRCFVELQHEMRRGDTKRLRQLRDLAEAEGARMVATGNVHAHTAARARLHEVLTAVRHGVTIDACAADRRCNIATTLRAPAVMAQRFAMAPAAIAATREIAERITFDITSDLGYAYPTFGGEDGATPDEVLAATCIAELDRRYDGHTSHATARARLERELTVIDKRGLAGFFLLHSDVLELAREVALDVRGASAARACNPPGRGRGSSVESIVCYLTGLSHIDPLEANLKMGRFLHEDLTSVPDIDLDFPRDIRHELLARVFDRYGDRHVAMVAAHATYRKKSAIRDLGKALGLPQAELQRMAKTIDSWSAKGIAEHVERKTPRWHAFAHLAGEIADLPRHTGQHSGGVIIATSPLSSIVPLMPTAMPGRTICQWDKDSCADAGFLKIDVLGLGMLSAVEECVQHVADTTGEHLDLSRISYDDAKVYDDIEDGDTVGVFQIESRAQMQSLKRTRPRNLHDLAIQVALIRPGPIVGKSVNPYIHTREQLREHGTATIDYPHPLLEPVLKETFGAIVFQDQVIEVAMAIANFSAGQADGLRRVMTRKHAEKAMEEYRAEFIAGAATNGVDEQTADHIFGKLIGFSSYGFPRAHSVSFALLAYQSSWLRHYYPAHFVVSLINAQPMGFYPPDSLVRDARRNGVAALPVDINISAALSTVEVSDEHPDDRHHDALRIGLAHIHGITWQEASALTDERSERGPFADLADLARRVRLRDDQLEQLVMAGATDCLDGERRGHLWQLGMLARARHDQLPGTGGGTSVAITQEPLDMDAPDAPELAQMNLFDEVAADFATTGISTRGHPAELLRPLMPHITNDLRDVDVHAGGSYVDLIGVMVARQRPGTAKGVVFLLLEDEHTTCNVVIPPPVYQRCRLEIRGEKMVRVKGRVEVHDRVVNLIADDVQALPKVIRSKVPNLHPGKRWG